jgi:hypothetical protein
MLLECGMLGILGQGKEYRVEGSLSHTSNILFFGLDVKA